MTGPAHVPLAAPVRPATGAVTLVSTVVCGLFLAYAALFYIHAGPTMLHDGDFFALWSYGVVAASHPTADLYDPGRLHALQVGLGMDPVRDNPFPYLPTFLPVARALGAMPLGVACAAWLGLGLGAFAWAVAARPYRAATAAAALASPAVTVCVLYGQGGLACAALLLGGLRLMRRRPWLGGVLLGLLTLKPQLGLLVPVALVSAGAWRSVAAASAVAVGLVAASLAFGAAAWGEWLAAISGYQAWFSHWAGNVRLLPTVTACLLNIGLPAAEAHAGQALAALAMAALVWRLFRDGPHARALAAFPAATLLATPHALVYDMPMLAGGVILGLAARPPSLAGAAWPILALAVPALLVTGPAALPVAAPAIACYLAWAVLRPMPGDAVMRLGARARGPTASLVGLDDGLTAAEPQR